MDLCADPALPRRARSEFRSLARIIAREGAMAPAEKEMIENVMSFRRTFERLLQYPAKVRVFWCLVLPDALLERANRLAGHKCGRRGLDGLVASARSEGWA